MTVRAGGIIDGARKDLDMEWNGGHMLRPNGTRNRMALPVHRNI